MAEKPVNIEATFNGKPIEVLQELIVKRMKALKETSKDAVTATAINVFNSLKSSTKKAPLVGNKNMYVLRKMRGVVSGWEYKNGHYHRCVRNGNIRGPVDRTVSSQCRNLAGREFREGERVYVYKAQLNNENMDRTIYYAHAKNDQQVRDYIENVILARLLRKESGMAKYAIGIAQAKVSTRQMNAEKPSGAKQWRMAYEAGKITITNIGGIDSGEFGISFFDDLNYSGVALKGGDADLDNAMMKAANKTAGLIHLAFVNKAFDEDVQTPFPEVQRKR